jgi:hypothetical protein
MQVRKEEKKKEDGTTSRRISSEGKLLFLRPIDCETEEKNVTGDLTTDDNNQ